VASAQNDSRNVSEAYKRIAYWSFDDNVIGKWNGDSKIEKAGLTTPDYPNFSVENKSAYFGGKTSLEITEKDFAAENLKFENGQTVTLEAWVNPGKLSNNQYAYIIGKGRNGKKEFIEQNQNYALRLHVKGNLAYPSFLFASKADKTKKGDHHRWTSTTGFPIESGWYHLAVTYTFGKGSSLKAWINGQSVDGNWDIGGKTNRAPMTDDDDIIIGTGYTKGPANTYKGWIDEVAVYRGELPAPVLAKHSEQKLHLPEYKIADVTPGVVTVEICEKDIPSSGWPIRVPEALETYQMPYFALLGVPRKYIETGVREDRPNPYLVRTYAVVNTVAGEHRILVRSFNACRLMIDGKYVTATPFRVQSSDGSINDRVDITVPKDLGPQTHFAPPGNQESLVTHQFEAGPHIVVMETIVGGWYGKNPRRFDVGETLIAIAPAGQADMEIVGPGTVRELMNDENVEQIKAEQLAMVDVMNIKARAKCREQTADYWTHRREDATQWLKNTPNVTVPTIPAGYPVQNEIDKFIAAKIEEVKKVTTAANDGSDFHREILPILQAKCFMCHSGAKVKGGLNLDKLDAALKGGESSLAAITPGNIDDSELLRRAMSHDASEVMPPKGDKLTAKEIELITKWIKTGAVWPSVPAEKIEFTELTDDLSFLRRLSLDTVGVVPSRAEIELFLQDKSPKRRVHAIDRYLDDARWANRWTSYWQDVLAENPNILNPTLNNTGPFRWWIHESLVDNKPIDMMVTELIHMNGSKRDGGPAGFAMASENDVPMAAKANIVSAAFLGVEMKCARCHDAPFHASSQEDLFALGAMLNNDQLKVPETSSVPGSSLKEDALIAVTLKPGAVIEPNWPFSRYCDADAVENMIAPNSTKRDQLAIYLTSHHNERFAQVIVNRLWREFMGRGIVEPVDDWERNDPTHPELLKWLGRELVRNNYDMKAVTRLILMSHAWQRKIDPTLDQPSLLMVSPIQRRNNAEQIVDSLFHVNEIKMPVESVNLDVDGGRDWGNSIDLGVPTHAWMFASTSNERDRPSLSLPRVQAVIDVLKAFGWRDTRQDPLTVRETAPNPIQPAIMANSTMSVWVTRMSCDHGMTKLALKDQTVKTLVDEIYLRYLTRYPTSDEASKMVEFLSPGYAERIVKTPPTPITKKHEAARYVSWSNHLTPEANEIKKELESAARQGDDPTPLLQADWRLRMEDAIWTLMNSPEFVFRP
jgi:hypothetical protein